MEVKPGYKQTEVGVIPEEWEVKTLGSLTTLLTNGFVGTATTAYVEGDDGVLYIQGYNVQENGFNFHGIKRVSKAFHVRNKKSCLQAGDLLTIQTGDIGVTTAVPPELVGANCHALIISRLRKQESEPGYYCQYFNSERGRVAFKEIETGTTMKHLNGGDMKRLFLPSPPVEEQRAIATALSDVDGLLGGLDRLIAKKRDLKQAAMQQLLTGQTRLPGFHGEWEAATIGDVCSFSGGSQPPRSTFRFVPTPGYVRLIQIRDYKSDDFACYIPEALARKRCTSEDIMIGRYGPPVFQILRGLEGAYNVALIKTTLSPKVERNFFFNVLNQDPLFQLIELLSRRSSGQTGVEISALKAYALPLPPLPEQTAIAMVLSEMDGELAVLEQRREKTRALKQAMMQELLTGRTRLV
jgi:type I restriction enzyme S subunit